MNAAATADRNFAGRNRRGICKSLKIYYLSSIFLPANTQFILGLTEQRSLNHTSGLVSGDVKDDIMRRVANPA